MRPGAPSISVAAIMAGLLIPVLRTDMDAAARAVYELAFWVNIGVMGLVLAMWILEWAVWRLDGHDEDEDDDGGPCAPGGPA